VYEARRAALPACSGVSACHVYTVVAGDSLSSIANYYGVSLAQLEQYNPQITTPDLIYADTAVRIPG
jgi:LysM repeat protein